MNPPDDAPSDSAKKMPLPPELEFLRQLPDASALGVGEYLQQFQSYLERVYAHRELMQAHGLDPKLFIITVATLLRQAQKSQAAFEASQETLLQKTADRADALRNLFQTLRPILEELYAEKPDDPQTQSWKVLMDEWAKQMPRGDAD